MSTRVGRCIVLMLTLSMMVAGCVRRTIRITSEPSNARVFLNDFEIGRTPATSDFKWYGDYDIVLRKEGYETLTTNWKVKAPWYQWPPLDFIVEVLYPGNVHDLHERHYVLAPQELPSPEDVVNRAMETRERTLQTTP